MDCVRTDQFDFDLPEGRIALRPLVPRDDAKLLVVNPSKKEILDSKVKELCQFLKPGDALVFNNTRVLPASLHALRYRADLSAKVALNLIKQKGERTWRAFVRPAKRLKPGDILRFIVPQTKDFHGTLKASIDAKLSEGEVELTFSLSGQDFEKALCEVGQMPLPPYISLKRAPDIKDIDHYQTIFATIPGAVAAPTASLHFTPDLVHSLEKTSLSLHYVTLHVGAGTFLPVKAEDTGDHHMHSEWAHLSKDTAHELNKVREKGGRIVAIGTTVLRTLETSAGENGELREWSGETKLFITPGYRFKTTDILMTNFHLPKSTLFMLVCAFSGLQTMKSAYAYAIENDYRFYSYGDACLLFPSRDQP